jgi:hypothetical protein
MRLERTDLELEVLMRRIEVDEIDLQPDFQRGEVWNVPRKRRLIDTILRGWYVPAIHLIRDPDTGKDLVLDGQQRLAAIREFFDGSLKVDGRLSPDDDLLHQLHDYSYSELPDDARRRVNRFPLSVVTLTDYGPEEPYELFFRLNQHMTLTPPEKRNALYGPARDQIKEVVDGLVEGGLLNRDAVGFANKRLAYDDVFARFALAVQLGTLRQRHSNNAIEDFYRGSEFATQVLSDVAGASRAFLERALTVSPKLNKATLYSWLIFAYTLRKANQDLGPDFLASFETLRATVRSTNSEIPRNVRAVILVYNDRASYRVNDTTSILLRDISLHVARNIETDQYTDRRIVNLSDALNVPDSAPPEIELVHFLEQETWDLPRG